MCRGVRTKTKAATETCSCLVIGFISNAASVRCMHLCSKLVMVSKNFAMWLASISLMFFSMHRVDLEVTALGVIDIQCLHLKKRKVKINRSINI